MYYVVNLVNSNKNMVVPIKWFQQIDLGKICWKKPIAKLQSAFLQSTTMCMNDHKEYSFQEIVI